MKVTGERIVPKDYQVKEYWTWKPAGEKPWIVRVFSKSRIWEDKGPLKNHAGFPTTNGDCDSSIRNESHPDSPVEDKYPDRMSSPLPFRSLH